MSGEELPEGWAETTLGAVTLEKVPQSTPSSAFTYVDISSVDNESKAIIDPKSLSVDEAPSRARQPLRASDVIVSLTRPNLNAVALVPDALDGSVGSTGFHVLRTSVCEPRFLFALVKGGRFVQEMTDVVKGALYPAINAEHVRAFGFGMPPLAEQKRIVARLDALQARSRAAREALAEVPALLDTFRQSVLAAAFRGDLTAEWRAKNPDVEPASKLLERIRAERRVRWQQEYPRKKYVEPKGIANDLPELPENWTWATTDELSFKLVDGVHHTPKYVPTGVPFITVKNLTAGPGISFEQTKFLSPEDHEECFKRANPQGGDVLITKDGTLGVIRVVDTDRTFSIFVSVALIKPVVQGGGDYLALALSAPETRGRTVATGSGLLHLHLGDLRAAPVALAPVEEQQEIQRQVRRVFAGIDALEASANEQTRDIDTLDQSILARAFRGELVDQDPNDEPAEALLARIRAGCQAASAPRRRRGGE